jgi:hypothetical protein
MKTIEYKLKSNPNRVIIVPEDYAKKAEELVNISMKIKNIEELGKVVNSNSYFRKGGYIGLVLDFLHLQRKEDEGIYIKARGEDRIYLTTCLNMAYEDLSYKEEEKKKKELDKIKLFDNILRNL